MIDADVFYNALSEGKVDEVKELTQRALADGIPPDEVLNDGLIKAMEQIGVRFRNGEIYIPEVLVAAHAMHAGLGVLKPILAKATDRKATIVVLGTVKGDMHDIGKNLVGMMLEGGGFEVIDLGVDVPEAKFVQAAKDSGAKLIAMSALLTTTMTNQRRLIGLLQEKGLRGKYRVLVGGAPASRKWAEEIGADGYAENAVAAVKLARSLAGRP